MKDKKVLDHFMEQLEFHSVKYAGQSEKEDWYLVKITDEMCALIDDEGDVISYAKHNYRYGSQYKYTQDYVLLAEKLYYCEYMGSKLEKVIGYNIEEDIKNMIFYDETGLLELVLNDQSVFMYEGQMIDTGVLTYFTMPNNYLKYVQCRNEVMYLSTVEENYYMSIANVIKRVYSEKSWRGKKLQKRFLMDVE